MRKNLFGFNYVVEDVKSARSRTMETADKKILNNWPYIRSIREATLSSCVFINLLSTNPTKWSNTQTIRREFADELFECV